MAVRPEVPEDILTKLRVCMVGFPECEEGAAWVGTHWRVRGATVVHVFGGEDQLFRIVFKAEAAEVLAFENLGAPYFKASWGTNMVGLVIDDATDWDEVGELMTDAYCLQAPTMLADTVWRPESDS